MKKVNKQKKKREKVEDGIATGHGDFLVEERD